MTIPPFDRRAIPDALRFSTVTMADGWRIRMFHWAQPEGEQARGRILFQTGRADFAEKYLETMAQWHERGWDVTGFDWRGQGGSRPGEGAVDFDLMLADLRAVISMWHTGGRGPHVAIGHSMGGHLLLRLLAEGEMGIDAAVLIAPMLGLNSRPLRPWMAAGIARIACRFGMGGRAVLRSGAVAAGRQGRLTADPDRYADERYWIDRSPDYAVQPPHWRWLDDAYASIARLARPGVLETVSVPVLLIGTTKDRLVDARAIQAAAARLPLAEIALRTTGAHELLREADPVRDAVIDRIDRFLDRFDAA